MLLQVHVHVLLQANLSNKTASVLFQVIYLYQLPFKSREIRF